MTKKRDIDFDKENICSMCIGEGHFTYFHNIREETVHQPCVCGDGTRVGELKYDRRISDRQSETLLKDLVELQDWVKETSKCKTCGGDQYSILGGIKCEECGLPGKAPWPG